MKLSEYRYVLDPSSRKYLCPICCQKRFVRYIDSYTSEYLPDQYGRCDREGKCSHHFNPYKDGYVKLIKNHESKNYSGSSQIMGSVSRPKIAFVQKSTIPLEVLQNTWQGWEHNIFMQNLLHRIPYPMEVKDIEKVISMYGIGTVCNGIRTGAITFPFIDIGKNIHAIQAKQFDKENHTISTDFIHSIIKCDYEKKNKPLPEWLVSYLQNEKKVTCLFGEHLLRQFPINHIALVEAPKTALIGTLYFGFPDLPEKMLWLGVYNRSSLTLEKCKVLQGRKVLLFPDLSKDGSTFRLWNDRVMEFNKQIPGSCFLVSDYLESHAFETDKAEGLDLADYLIRINWRTFRKGKQKLL